MMPRAGPALLGPAPWRNRSGSSRRHQLDRLPRPRLGALGHQPASVLQREADRIEDRHLVRPLAALGVRPAPARDPRRESRSAAAGCRPRCGSAARIRRRRGRPARRHAARSCRGSRRRRRSGACRARSGPASGMVAGLVGGDRRDDVGARTASRVPGGAAHQTGRGGLREVAHQLVGRGRVDVEGDDLLDAQMGVKASAWNSACAPLPISAMRRASGRSQRTPPSARSRRCAARWSASARQQHRPVSTSASTPKAITV